MTSQSHDLYAMKDGTFLVKSFKSPITALCRTPEEAADTLLALGVLDDEIDVAIMDMAKHSSNHAQFGILKGAFIYSDVVEERTLDGRV